MVNILGYNIEQLQAVAQDVGLPRFAAKQIAEWLYLKRAVTFDEMTNISLRGREALKARYTTGRHAPVAESISQDGTRKYLFQVGEQYVEAVYIPDNDRATLCVSTQAGCKMACRFCMTGTLGFHGQLPAAEILNQILSFPDLTNIVYMGEGEPMDNLDNVLQSIHVMTAPWGCAWSPKRITVSSVGIIPALKHFLDNCDCHLAISLHNPFGAERQEIMPIEKAYHLTDVVELLHQYDWHHQRRVSFEYICWGGINDTPKHANELLRLLRNLDCRINLIRFHTGVQNYAHTSSQTTYTPSNELQMQWFCDYLNAHGITTTIRRSRGEDILAACGMLVNALKETQK